MDNLNNNKITRLIDLEKKAREAKNKDELNFVITNETRKIVKYTTSFLLMPSVTDQLQVVSVSDIASVDRTAPTINFIEKVVQEKKNPKEKVFLDVEEIGKELKLRRPNNLPKNLYCFPVISPQKGVLGYLVFSKARTFDGDQIMLINHLSKIYGHCYNIFLQKFSLKKFIKQKLKKKDAKRNIAIAVLICLFPLQLKSTAPVEVVAKNPFIVTAPVDGVVKQIVVNNNDEIKQGDLLIELEDEDLKSNYNLALQSYKIAEKELLRGRQISFTNNEAKAKLNELAAQVDLKKIELKFAQNKMENTKINAKKNGIAIVDQKNEWQGRPVNIGEKIITIADPKEVEFLVWLPVKDSLVIKEGNDIRVFLDVNPVFSLKGKLSRASYAPSLSPQEVLSYKITGSYEGSKPPRIGLRGTATVYGSNTVLIYYVLRKPITFLRQFIGI